MPGDDPPEQASSRMCLGTISPCEWRVSLSAYSAVSALGRELPARHHYRRGPEISKYRLTANGQFLLYSVGWNERDDNGNPEKDKGDWVWPVEVRK